jgi:hypothetical protein
MRSDNDASHRDGLRLAAPLLLVSGACLAVVPWIHPNNTCTDWLMKWGQLAAHPLWLPIHQVAMAGFALAAPAAAALALLGRRSALGLFAGASLAAGLAIQGMMVLVHATAVSRMGEAFNAATTDVERQTLRSMAEAFVRYDVGSSAVAAALLSVGAALMAWHLAREGALSLLAGVFFAGLGTIWGLQAHGFFRRLHIPTTEWIPYTSLALWMAGLGLILLTRRHDLRAEAARGGARREDEPLPQNP